MGPVVAVVIVVVVTTLIVTATNLINTASFWLYVFDISGACSHLPFGLVSDQSCSMVGEVIHKQP